MNRIYSLLLIVLIPVTGLIGQTTFTDQATQAGLDHYFASSFEMGGGVAIFDFNGDTLEDLYYTGGLNSDALYQNNGDGTFTDVSISAQLGFTSNTNSMAVTTGDIDNDGFREVFVCTFDNEPNFLLYNNGDGSFTDISLSSGIATDSVFSMGASFGDFNSDGFLDVYVANYIDTPGIEFDTAGALIAFTHVCFPNQLFLNNGDNTFTDVSQSTLTDDAGCSLATTFSDFDNDLDVDILVANDFGQWISPNSLFENNGDETYSDISIASAFDHGMYGMGFAVGDYDQDLDLDYYVTNIGANILVNNNGNQTFSEVSTFAGVSNQWVYEDSLQATGWGTGFQDIDNDSRLDLFVSNGHMPAVVELMTSTYDPNKLYHNSGDGTFTDISSTSGIDLDLVCRGFAAGDYDNDGDIDLFPVPIVYFATVDTPNMLVLNNELDNSNNWLKVQLEGTETNRDAFGTHLEIYVGGNSWLHEISGGASHTSQHSSIAHFGLGADTIVDSLIIYWPRSEKQTLTDVAANQQLYVKEGDTIVEPPPPTAIRDELLKHVSIYPNPVNETIHIEYGDLVEEIEKLEIFTVFGELVWSGGQNLSDKQERISINVLDWAKGFYYVRVETNGNWAYEKILIE